MWELGCGEVSEENHQSSVEAGCGAATKEAVDDSGGELLVATEGTKTEGDIGIRAFLGGCDLVGDEAARDWSAIVAVLNNNAATII